MKEFVNEPKIWAKEFAKNLVKFARKPEIMLTGLEKRLDVPRRRCGNKKLQKIDYFAIHEVYIFPIFI
jgi:hypothetical protein